jgi:NADH-quinone oxidoreductase subunit M
MGVFQYNVLLTLFACTSMVLGAVYTLWTYNRIFFGNIKVLSLTKFKDINKKEFTLFGILVVILFLMGIAPYIFLDAMFLDCLNILEHAKGNRIL